MLSSSSLALAKNPVTSTLDMLGNWDEFRPDTPTATLDQTRDHNFANELTDIEVNSTSWADFVHDKAGNLTYQGTSSGTRRKFTWDAWNRLRQVDYQVDIGGGGSPSWAGSTRARSEYYGLHQRSQTLADEEG